MKTLPGSKTPKILELHAQGANALEIATAVNVARTYVYKVLRHHGHRSRVATTMTISIVGSEDLNWLRAEARRTRTRVPDLARAMLTDAIYEARNGKD
jgi:hypothetical protein